MTNNREVKKQSEMAEKFYGLKYDIVFKKFFVENSDLLKQFISDMLDIPFEEIGEVTVENPDLIPDEVDGKYSRLDIRANISNSIINIEMQSTNKEDYKERVLFYWARIYNDELKKGNTYDKVRRCICINILNFKMFDCKEYHSSFSVREDKRNELLTDRMHLHFFELPKVSTKPDTADSVQLWLQLFKAKRKGDFDMLKETNVAEIQKGIDVIYLLNEDEKIREQARQREIAEINYRSDISNAENKGRETGRVEGKEEKAVEIALNLLKLKTMSVETIASVSGLSIEKIQELTEKI